MAHTDPFIFLPIVIWVFVSFWVVYILVTAIFLPLIYNSYRARTLVLSYLSNDVYNQVSGIMGFYFLITNITHNFYSVMSNFMRVYMLIMKLNINVYMNNTSYVIGSYSRIFKVS